MLSLSGIGRRANHPLPARPVLPVSRGRQQDIRANGPMPTGPSGTLWPATSTTGASRCRRGRYLRRALQPRLDRDHVTRQLPLHPAAHQRQRQPQRPAGPDLHPEQQMAAVTFGPGLRATGLGEDTRFHVPLAGPGRCPLYVRAQLETAGLPWTQRDIAGPKATARKTGKTQATGYLRRWWQVLGSNQRRLSRRFYREPTTALPYGRSPADTPFPAA
jgi:hypothetical protein